MSQDERRASLSFFPDGEPDSPSVPAFATPTTNNNSLSLSHLIATANGAAIAYGCDILQLLRSTPNPPKIHETNVACSPGGHRSSRAIEQDIAKTRGALAVSLAEAFLAVLWQSYRRDDKTTDCHSYHYSQSDGQSQMQVATRPGELDPGTESTKNAEASAPAVGNCRPPTPIAIAGFQQQQQQQQAALISVQPSTHSLPPDSGHAPQRGSPPQRGSLPQQQPNDGGVIKLSLWLPPQQHPPEEPPTVGEARHQGPLLPAGQSPKAPVLEVTKKPSVDSGSQVSSLLPGSQRGGAGGGGGSDGRSPPPRHEYFAAVECAPPSFPEGGGRAHGKASVLMARKSSDDPFLSAFVTATDIGAARRAPKTSTMATFLKNVDDATAVSATTGGAVNLSSNLPIEFTATHHAKQARSSDSNRWVLNGRYMFLSKLGAGGQGAVWRVADLFTGQHLAIKIVPRGKMRRNCKRFSVATATARSSAGIGLLAGDISNETSVVSTGATRNDDDATRRDQGSRRDRLCFDNSCGPGIDSRSRSHFSNTAALHQSALLDGSALLAQSTDVLRLFYEGGARDGGALPESLAVEIVMGLFQHPNTVPLMEVIDDPSCNNVFLVMPLAKPLPFSLNLASGQLNAEGPSVDTILGYARGAASALSVFHAAGIVHCDIKLDNLLLLSRPTSDDNEEQGEDVLVIADFGVCQLSVNGSSPQPGGQVSLLGGGSGTYAYWAPECFAAKQQRDTFTAASDCYALGLCLYAMVFGQFPYWTADVMNPLSWEMVVPGTARYQGANAAVVLPPIHNGGNSHESSVILSEIIQGLLAPAPHNRMSAKKVADLAM